ncbi:Crp/Fnr family transcriptional regulator [Frankia sp. Ag45/Mut15]|uniref:Crp/Fnr family transcriptional regulator n=1 Tax=Frankia umida TaxID=573489 RepID=A0ABT0K5C0_9ACTN|nr:Crp/Fnr family transcriptional regulator [Frankia umida]MCK9879002.1 Crp/Fnr family transcriptional regulator [Frankia umida]
MLRKPESVGVDADRGSGFRLVEWPAESFLGQIPTVGREEILRLGTPRVFADEEALMWEGDQSSFVVVLLEGWVKVTAATENGHFALLAIRRGGDLVGELAAIDALPRMATVVAAGPVRATVLSAEAFLGCLRRHPLVHQVVSGTLGAKFRAATRRRVEFAGYPVALRVMRVILELGQMYGRPVADQHGAVAIPLTQPEIAALVGAAEPTVHKVLRDLRRRGLLSTGYRSVIIRDPRLLWAELACLDSGSRAVQENYRAAGA